MSPVGSTLWSTLGRLLTPYTWTRIAVAAAAVTATAGKALRGSGSALSDKDIEGGKFYGCFDSCGRFSPFYLMSGTDRVAHVAFVSGEVLRGLEGPIHDEVCGDVPRKGDTCEGDMLRAWSAGNCPAGTMEILLKRDFVDPMPVHNNEGVQPEMKHQELKCNKRLED